MKNLTRGFIGALILSTSIFSQEIQFPQMIKALDSNLPDNEAKIFAPGKVSTSTDDWKIAFCPTGKEIFFTVTGRAHAAIVNMKYVGGIWTKPEVMSFSGHYFDFAPTLSADGKRMIFVSRRPTGRPDDTSGTKFWMVQRIGNTWGDPKLLSDNINKAGTNLMWPCLAANDDLYFVCKQEHGYGGTDIYKSTYMNGEYQQPQNIGSPVNSELGEYCPFIAPDGSYIIFEIVDKKGGLGKGDMYISIRKDDGDWGEPQNMGKAFNSRAHDCYPTLSPDGKYLFFQSERRVRLPREQEHFSYSQLLKQSQQSGGWDIYWIHTDALKPFLNAK
ncbi:PD40 domain-containing protein [bacterium]|nr:PD40 domain-containing protein [bacterium]